MHLRSDHPPGDWAHAACPANSRRQRAGIGLNLFIIFGLHYEISQCKHNFIRSVRQMKYKYPAFPSTNAPFSSTGSASAPDAVHPDDVSFRNEGDRPIWSGRPVARRPVRLRLRLYFGRLYDLRHFTAKFGGPLRHHAHHLL